MTTALPANIHHGPVQIMADTQISGLENIHPQDLGVKVRTRDEIPPTYASLSNEWLSEVLSTVEPGTRVVGHSLSERDDGTSNRRRIHVEYGETNRNGALPTCFFGKMSEQISQRETNAITGIAEKEAVFYKYFRPIIDIEAPECYFAEYDPETHRSFILMRDISDRASFHDQDFTVDHRMAEGMVITLARLHSQFLDRDFANAHRVSHFTDWWNNMARHYPAMEDSCREALIQSVELGIASPSLGDRNSELWAAIMFATGRHARLPATLTHNDVHFKNWYCLDDGRMGLADWQTVARGHWSRDLIYALSTALTVENRRLWLDDLVRLYVEEMQRLGATMPTIDQVWLNLRQQLFSAFAFWAVTLLPAPGMPEMQPRNTTIEFLRRFYAAMEDYDSFDAVQKTE